MKKEGHAKGDTDDSSTSSSSSSSKISSLSTSSSTDSFLTVSSSASSLSSLSSSQAGLTPSSESGRLVSTAQLFEGRLVLNAGFKFSPAFFFLCSKAFSRTVFSVIFRASNHQREDKKN